MNRLLHFAILLFSASVAFAQDGVLRTDSTSNSTITSDSTTTVNSPPPSAISPSINTSNSDLCTIGVAGAVQTQILGISAGTAFTEENCERLKNAKTLYDMGMKVAAVSVMCEDRRVFEAMMHAGTPCPYNGQIGESARIGWENDPSAQPEGARTPRSIIEMDLNDDQKSTAIGLGAVGGLLLLLLL